jgi:hypothetical protein
MTFRERLDQVLASLPDNRLSEIYDFARYLRWLEQQEKEERAAWTSWSPSQIEQLYGPDDDEYTEADIKPELNK